MRAMVLAAGLGTRLGPLTRERPKALVEIAGRTLLEIALGRLRSFGIREVIINLHHFAETIASYLEAHGNFGMSIALSCEDELLDTGGGLKKAGWFFRPDAGATEPFLVHNVDVLSTIDFDRLVEYHRQNDALATLAVKRRKTSRYLLFDDGLKLCGRRSEAAGVPELVCPAGPLQELAFCGIHVIAHRFLSLMSEQGAFSIISCYLRLAAQGEKILGFPADEYYWRDLGKPENIVEAERDLKQGMVAQ